MVKIKRGNTCPQTLHAFFCIYSVYKGQVVQANLHAFLLFDKLSVTLIFSKLKFKADINTLKHHAIQLTTDK